MSASFGRSRSMTLTPTIRHAKCAPPLPPPHTASVRLSYQMYTLLFEAMMLPRFGMFEDCESPPLPVANNASSSGDTKDPAERAFASRFSGGDGLPSEGGTIGNHPRDENAIYLEAVMGEEVPAAEEEGEEGDEGEEGSQFEATLEAQRLIVESAASAGGSGEGKGGATFLPVARPDGYSDAQLVR